MYKLNQLFNKEVVNQVTGDKIGYVSDVILDADVHNVVALLVSKTGPFQPTFVARWDKVTSSGTVIVLNAPDQLPLLAEDFEIEELKHHAMNMSGTNIIGANGEKIGTVVDLLIDETGKITGYEVSPGLLKKHQMLDIEHVQAAGNAAVIATVNELNDFSDGEPQPNATVEPHADQVA